MGSFRNGGTTDAGFKFTSASEAVNATTATIGNAGANNDSLSDGSTSDNDVLNVAVTGATALAALSNIETVNFTTTASTGAAAITWIANAVNGVKTVTVSGAGTGILDLDNGATSGGLNQANTIDSTGLTSTAGITIDASGRTGTSATEAMTVTLGGTGQNTILTSGGADSITGSNGVDLITSGAGDDTISTAGGNDTIDAGSGNDTIDGGTGNNSITGGSGDDAITLSGTVDTVIFNGVGAVSPNGKDTITGFDAGTAAGADILNVSAGLNVAGVATAATALTALTATGAVDFGGAVSTAANAVLVLDRATAIAGENYSATADFAKIFAATAAINTTQTATAAHKLLVVQGTDQTQLYMIQADRDGASTDITTSDVVLVGVLTDVTNTTAFAAANFLV